MNTQPIKPSMCKEVTVDEILAAVVNASESASVGEITPAQFEEMLTNAKQLILASEEANNRRIEVQTRIQVSQAIKRQRENYRANNLFSVDYQEGMSDAALIAYDADKNGWIDADGQVIYE